MLVGRMGPWTAGGADGIAECCGPMGLPLHRLGGPAAPIRGRWADDWDQLTTSRSRAPAANFLRVLSTRFFASAVPPSTLPATLGSAYFSKVLSTCFFASATLSSKYTCRKEHML